MKTPLEAFRMLKSGGIGVMPTDTIYGLIGSAFNKKTVERIYRLRRRNPKKPMIILIGSLGQLKLFGVKPNRKTAHLLKTIWFDQKRHPYKLKFVRMTLGGKKPAARHSHILENVRMSLRGRRPTSVILPLSTKNYSLTTKLRYLHRGTKTLAFRLPKPAWLRRLLIKTGPLTAPSANPEGKPPAKTIREAKSYFGSGVDFYVDHGKLDSRPSKLIRIIRGKIEVLRK